VILKNKRTKLTDLRLQIQACIRCPYASVRNIPFFGDGEYRSPILVIGSSPRKVDDDNEEVFSGRAGRKLGRMFSGAELDINKVYRTYLIRCYGGREPSFGEFSAFRRCHSHTSQIIKIMQPTSVVLCGYKTFKWLILKWTREVVDEHDFYKWIGRSVRLKEVWGDLKFFIIESPATLSKKQNIESEKKSIDTLVEMKQYVVAQQKGEPIALKLTDLRRRPQIKSKQQTFGWS
jgi:uracil-DNA glycosylase